VLESNRLPNGTWRVEGDVLEATGLEGEQRRGRGVGRHRERGLHGAGARRARVGRPAL